MGQRPISLLLQDEPNCVPYNASHVVLAWARFDTAMKPLTKTVSILLIVILCDGMVLPKEWRGITPLHSTRNDVERRLGPPTNRSPFGFYYNLPDEIAVVRIQTESCDGTVGRFGIGWNIPVDTVTDIGIIPKRTVAKDRFVIGNDFKSETANAGFSYFTNDKAGLSVETYNGTVTLVTYSPSATEVHRHCPRVKECCIDFFPRFDEYGLLPFEDEKARLDNFVIQMREWMYRGALVIFGETAAARNKLLKRAQRAKRYLVQTRGLESQRLLIIDGGYRERPATELHLYMIGGEISRIYLFPEKDPR